MRTIIKVNKVCKNFAGRLALYDMTFDVGAGEIFGLMGSSGSGKTTLLNTIVGFIKPEEGDIFFKSEFLRLKTMSHFISVFSHAESIKREIGFASQHPSIYPELTCTENLRYFASLYDISKEAIQKNIGILFQLMELDNVANVLAKNLSGGMQRRLDIACALIHDPKILILDEPTADLDPFLRKQLWYIIKKINEKGTTIIVSSHNLTDLEEMCDRIAIINAGRLIELDTPLRIKKKFFKTEEVRIESFPGNYKKIKSKIKNKDINDVKIVGNEIVIQCEAPHDVLIYLLKLFSKEDETIIDVKIAKMSLDDVFMEIASYNTALSKNEASSIIDTLHTNKTHKVKK